VLPRSTLLHWILGGVTAAVFLGSIPLVIPLGKATLRQLWIVGLIVATAGILLLLGFQLLADHFADRDVGGGIAMWIYGLIQLIGKSYRLASDPNASFWLSLVGFTFGVALCEELCKALPLVVAYRFGAVLDLRGAVTWGFAMGVGFGVSEGVIYSSDFYNGISTATPYMVRFLSCVTLHAVWTAGVAILLWRERNEIEESESWLGTIFPTVWSLRFAVLVHGLYDTLLKKNYSAVALVVAIGSVAGFVWFFERNCRQEAALMHASNA